MTALAHKGARAADRFAFVPGVHGTAALPKPAVAARKRTATLGLSVSPRAGVRINPYRLGVRAAREKPQFSAGLMDTWAGRIGTIPN